MKLFVMNINRCKDIERSQDPNFCCCRMYVLYIKQGRFKIFFIQKIIFALIFGRIKSNKNETCSIIVFYDYLKDHFCTTLAKNSQKSHPL